MNNRKNGPQAFSFWISLFLLVNGFLSCHLLDDRSFSLTTKVLDPARCGKDYLVSFETTAEEERILEFSVYEGDLPRGLRLNKATGVLSGRPSGDPETARFSVRAIDLVYGTVAEQEYSLTVEGWDWLIAVYMGGDNSLSTQVAADLAEMQSGIGALSGVKLFALADSRNGAVLFEGMGSAAGTFVERPLGLLGMTDGQEVNMAAGSTLSLFLEYAFSSYPAEHTALIFWNHGDGWRSLERGFSEGRGICTDESHPDDRLYTAEIEEALNTSSRSGFSIDVLAFDLCYGGMLEIAYELRNTADYLVASEAKENEAGWDYEALFRDFASTEGTPAAFCSSLVDSYEATWSSSAEDYTFSALDLSKISMLSTAFEILVGELETSSAGGNRESIRSVFLGAQSFGDLPGDFNIDLRDAVDGFTDFPWTETIRSAASACLTAFDAAVIDEWSTSADAHGLAIHLVPLEVKTASGYTANDYDPAYRKGFSGDYPLDFVEDSSWTPDFINATGLLYRLFVEGAIE